MERLTELVGEWPDRYAIPSRHIRSNGHQRCCNRLAEYEDLVIDLGAYTSPAYESGKAGAGWLVHIPFKAGDTLYGADFCNSCVANVKVLKVVWENGISHGEPFTRGWIIVALGSGDAVGIDFNDIGQHWFLSESEAGKKLKEGISG